MRKLITDALDVLGILAISASVGRALYDYIGWWAFSISGLIIIVVSQVVASFDRD